MRRDRLALLALTLTVLACNLPTGISVTPTIPPTLPPTLTPTLLPSPTPSDTAVALLPSLTPSDTATPTPTATPSPTDTPTETPPPSETPSALPTFTATPTETPTGTATSTSEPTSTGTPIPSDTPTPTDTPFPTETLTLVPTDLPAPTLTWTATVSPSPIATLVSSPTPVPPTLTPPPRDLGIIPTMTPILVAGPPTGRPTRSSPPIVTVLAPAPPVLVTQAPTNTAVVIASVPTLPPSLVRDPRYQRYQDSAPGHTAAIDLSSRWLYIDQKPFDARQVPRGVETQFTQVRWSPDGRWLAFVAQVPNPETVPPDDPNNRLIDDGLWVLDTATNKPYFVYRQIYHAVRTEGLRLIDDIIWASDSDAILLTLRRSQGKASVIVGVRGAVENPKYPDLSQTFPLHDYAGGAALPGNQQGFVVTGSAPGQSSRLGILRYDGRFEPVADGAALGLWMQNAALLPDGRIAFLGKSSPTGRFEDSAEPLRLYVMAPGGQPVARSVVSPGFLFADWDVARSTLLVHVRNGQNVSVIPLHP